MRIPLARSLARDRVMRQEQQRRPDEHPLGLRIRADCSAVRRSIPRRSIVGEDDAVSTTVSPVPAAPGSEVGHRIGVATVYSHGSDQRALLECVRMRSCARYLDFPTRPDPITSTSSSFRWEQDVAARSRDKSHDGLSSYLVAGIDVGGSRVSKSTKIVFAPLTGRLLPGFSSHLSMILFVFFILCHLSSIMRPCCEALERVSRTEEGRATFEERGTGGVLLATIRFGAGDNADLFVVCLNTWSNKSSC